MMDGGTVLGDVAIIVGSAATVGLFAVYFVAARRNPDWEKAALKHPQATAGIPFAAMLSFMIVMIFKTTTIGPIAFSGLGFRFEGPAAPVVMWVLCFLAVVIALRTLWPPHKAEP